MSTLNVKEENLNKMTQNVELWNTNVLTRGWLWGICVVPSKTDFPNVILIINQFHTVGFYTVSLKKNLSNYTNSCKIRNHIIHCATLWKMICSHLGLIHKCFQIFFPPFPCTWRETQCVKQKPFGFMRHFTMAGALMFYILTHHFIRTSVAWKILTPELCLWNLCVFCENSVFYWNEGLSRQRLTEKVS